MIAKQNGSSWLPFCFFVVFTSENHPAPPVIFTQSGRSKVGVYF
jgi:hypothetical protein